MCKTCEFESPRPPRTGAWSRLVEPSWDRAPARHRGPELGGVELRHRLPARRRAHQGARLSPGKAPRHVIDRFVGKGTVIAEAIDHLVSDSYDAALDQITIIPIDQPEVDIDPAGVAEGQPVLHRHRRRSSRGDAGAYTGYPFALEVPDVTDEQVEGVITELRQEQATLRPIDDRAAEGDVAAVKFVGTIDGEPFEAARPIACRW